MQHAWRLNLQMFGLEFYSVVLYKKRHGETRYKVTVISYYLTGTPSRTPVRPRITNVSVDLTPRRINTPTLTLSSILLPSPTESKTSPTKLAPGTYILDSQRSVSHSQSPCSVRQNLLNALNQDGSLSNITSTNSGFKVPSVTSSSQLGSRACNKKPTVTSSIVQNDSLFAVSFCNTY